MWSDPEDDLETWGQGARGAGYLFGSKVVSGFCHINNLDLICRSHQLVQGMLTENEGENDNYHDGLFVNIFLIRGLQVSLPGSESGTFDTLLLCCNSLLQVTVWSAPNYCYRCGNLASILQLDADHTRTYKLFLPAPESSIEVPAQKPVPYFV